MLGKESGDFSYYSHEFKDNYRKGVHRLRAILAVPLTAEQFAANRGGVAAVLGTPVGKEDRNSAELRDLLLGSGVVDRAVESWLHGFYDFPEGDADALFGDAETCRAVRGGSLLFRAVSASPVAMGKLAVTLAGGDCRLYQNMAAVAASDTAMAAVAGSQAAMSAVAASATAMNAVAASATAMTAVAGSATAMSAVAGSQAAMTAVAASTTAMAAVAASSTAMNIVAGSQTAMTAVAGSSTAMNAVAASQTAMNAVGRYQIALSDIYASNIAIAKYAASLAKLNPTDYETVDGLFAYQADRNAVVSSQLAMTAVAASSVAMSVVATSQTVIALVASTPLALNAVCKNPVARSYFNGSSYRDAYYSVILNSCKNTTYFNMIANNIQISSGNNNYWCSYDPISGHRYNNSGSDAAGIVLVDQIYWYGNYNYAGYTNNMYQLWLNNNAYNSGSWFNLCKVAMGGFHFWGTNHKVYSFTPK